METKDNNPIPLHVFAKTPTPGKVKTRMQPHLNEQQSAELAVMMMEHTMASVSKHWPGKRILAVTPDDEHPVFRRFADQYGFEIEIQAAGNLGRKMWHVLEQGIRQAGGSVVIGSDVPHCPGALLERAMRDVRNRKNVVGPALDGGFYLLGLSHVFTGIFQGIAWGGSGVLDQLLRNAAQQNVTVHQYPVLRDIDCWDDLAWLKDQDPRYRSIPVSYC